MRQSVRAAVAVGAAVATAAGVAAFSAPAQAATVKLDPKGSIQVTYRGNGQGDGMSQYGAYGAALAGQSYTQILASYYHGTTIVKVNPTGVRVRLSGNGTTTTVQAVSGTTMYGMTGALPVTGVQRYRLIANSGAGLTLQKLPTSSTTWITIKTHVPNGAWFHRTAGLGVQVIDPDGSSTFYDHYVKAYRVDAQGAAGGVYSVNYTGLEDYTAGVTPREMPSSWSRAAVDAQAIAARSYVSYFLQHPMARFYDICDSANCQVFGGTQHIDKSGNVQWTDFPQAAADTDHLVLNYQGAPIFAQFSASDGGWSTDGGQPYLRAAADPYDPGESGDPYINATKTVKVATLAKSVGLTTVTGLSITKRDGNGTWGGRVLSAVVTGTSGSKAASKTVTGYELQSAFGLGTIWLKVAAAS